MSNAGNSTPARFLFAADVLRRCIAAILSPETAREDRWVRVSESWLKSAVFIRALVIEVIEYTSTQGAATTGRPRCI